MRLIGSQIEGLLARMWLGWWLPVYVCVILPCERAVAILRGHHLRAHAHEEHSGTIEALQRSATSRGAVLSVPGVAQQSRSYLMPLGGRGQV